MRIFILPSASGLKKSKIPLNNIVCVHDETSNNHIWYTELNSDFVDEIFNFFFFKLIIPHFVALKGSKKEPKIILSASPPSKQVPVQSQQQKQ